MNNNPLKSVQLLEHRVTRLEDILISFAKKYDDLLFKNSSPVDTFVSQNIEEEIFESRKEMERRLE